MPQPRKTDRPIEKSISIPTSLATRIDLMLYSEVESRVPHGAWSRLVAGLLQNWLDNIPAQAKPAEPQPQVTIRVPGGTDE